ncbi:PAS domain-containing protein, partial [Coleofasciculus sp. FACHB-712]|uniref:PAS domain-containing protein n=1 Tax=Coleofasciculus sp. FACHB-712 TaxID=2692789 RepID=UPI0016864389
MSETELEAAHREAEASTTALAVSISEAAEQEVAARSAAEAHRRFVELVQGLDAIVWEMDAVTWKFTFVSDRAQDILGYPIGQWLDEPTFWQDCLLHPEDRDWCVNFCVSATNQARDHEFQYRAIASDSRVVWLKDVVRVVCDEQGCPKLLRGVMVDITKEKEAEEKTQLLLREQAARIEVETVQEALRKS